MRFEPRPARKHLVAFKLTTDELQALRQAVVKSGAKDTASFLRRLVAMAVSFQ